MKNTLFICLTLLLSATFAQAKPFKGEGKIIGSLDGQVLATGSGRVFMIDSKGQEVWSRKAGNNHDVWMLDNGNILYADGVIHEVNPKTDQEVFTYTPKILKGGGAYSCQRLENGNTLVGENSSGKILELDPKGKVVFELQTQPFKQNNHHNLRMVRKIKNGNYLACHSGANLVREYTPKGEIVQEIKLNKLAFSAQRLENGNTLIGNIDRIVEFTAEGDIAWECSNSDIEGVQLGKICGVNTLPNGNMVLGIYSIKKGEAGATFLEITREKKLVWRYVQLPKGDRSAMSAQKLDNSGKAISKLR
ncbi:MAG: hypothetical protein HQL32_05765 [Planctomycetes bacterium]|nr:hypothetical protein [Planctomycetota bacterium]